MKILIFVALLASLVFTEQITAQDSAKLEVVKFNWGMFERRRVINELPLFDEVTTVRPSGRNNRSREKTIEEQSQDLARVENAAKRSASMQPGNIFVYELKIKNLDEKNIKSFIWEYRLIRKTELQSAFSRRFLCVGKIKAGDSKTLRIISNLPPVNVVDASAPGGNSKGDFAVEVIIDRVEYADGTVWKKAGWDDSGYALDSRAIAEKLKFNDCAAL
jgi:hypothetical protein